uniref:Uncharacterized protein n=1 Tax=Trichobilharzia regenti TaxID=157069 RepID=A0AA85KMY0_TRIRE|nr:unnamed protein product [Trichobilharzia regenti]
MNVTVATCESAVYKYSNFVNVSECSLVVGDIEFMNQIEMVKYFNVQLIVPFLSSGLFTLNSSSVTPTYAEIHHVEYLYVDKDNSNAIRNIRLISEYILGASNTRRFEANTILGIFENNKTSLSDTYNFRVGIKFYFNAAVTVGSVISIRFQVTASSTSLPRVQKNVPITSIIMPPTTAPLSKYPILTLRKIDPYYSKPMVQFTTTLEARVRFMMDFLYSPIVIQLNSTGGTLYRHAVFTVGHILDTTTPIGLPIITGARLARLTIQSVYYNETCNDGRCEIAVRYSLYLDSNSPILVTSVVLFGTLPVVKTENITPQVYNASFLTSAIPPSDVELVSCKSPLAKNIVTPNAITQLRLVIFLNLLYIFMWPTIFGAGSALTLVNSGATFVENDYSITISNVYYEAWNKDSALSSSNTVQSLIPIFVRETTTGPLKISYILTVGSTNVSGYYTFYTGAPEVSTPNLSIQYSPTLTHPNGLYGHMCSGTTFALLACHILRDSRCAFYTAWINRISPGVGSMNVSQMSSSTTQSGVYRQTSYSLNMTYLGDVIRADYGPICVISEMDTRMCIRWTVRLMGDCNQTTMYNFVFPVQVQISGRPGNISVGDVTFSFQPLNPIYSQMTTELTPTDMTLQPGQIGNFTIKYAIPLYTSYTKFTVSVNCTANTSNVDAVLTVKGFQVDVGSNLVNETSAYSFNYSSSYKTGQLDQLTVYFDRVINSATALGLLIQNTLSITVNIQLSDSQRVEIGTTWPVQFTTTFTNTSTVTRYNNSSVTCTRTGLEKPIIQFALSQLSVNTLQDCVDRYLVYIQTLVQMNNETGLECETQSIFFYFGSPVESINVFNQTGNNSEILTTIPLDPATRSVKFSVGPLYFGQKYSIVFQVKYPKSLRPPVNKLPVLVEVVCKPYERSIAFRNRCRKPKFFRFMSPIRVEVDYRAHTYPCDLPHYVAMKNPKVPLLSTRLTTFLNVGDRLFYCGRVLNWKLSFEEQRRCFMISPLPQRIWSDMGPSVAQILAYDNSSGALLGLGANGGGALKSLNFGLKWIAVNSFEYQRTVNASTQIITASVTPWISLTGSYEVQLLSHHADSVCWGSGKSVLMEFMQINF